MASATSVSVWAAGRWSVGITVSGTWLGGWGLRGERSVATLRVQRCRTFVQDPFIRAQSGKRRRFRPVRARPWGAVMSLTLISGPANSAKAGEVLERLRAALAREPGLVVPTAAGAAHYARELAGAGIVFGAQVTTFSGLTRDIARLAGSAAPGRRLGRLARGRVVRAVVAASELRALAASSRAPGFADALGDFFAELQRSLTGPGRFAAAVRMWHGGPPHAAELAALYRAYHRQLEVLGAVDADGFALAALEALRARPAAWGARPLFWYGFDELTPAQLDVVETLVRFTETPVCVALPYEPGRAALAGSAATVELLKPLAAEHVVLPPRSEHYAESARGALHHLERSLFEPAPARRPPNGAVRLLEAGGERAEAELVGASILELLRDGMAPEDIAVLVRGELSSDLFAQVLEGYGIPVSRERTTPLARTRLGAGVLAFARAALPGGAAQDVVTWLRTPGKTDPDRADRLEVAVRRREARTAHEARRLFARLEPGGGELAELDALAAAAREGAEPFLATLLAEAEATWTAPHVRQGAVLSPEAEGDARAAAALRSAVGELVRLAAVDAALAGGPAELLEALSAVDVRQAPAADGVLLA